MKDSSKKLFVWDFHGVLEKGTERAGVIMCNNTLAAHGHEGRFTLSEFRDAYGLKLDQIFARKLPHASKDNLNNLQRSFFDTEANGGWEIISKHIKQNDNVLDVLTAIKRNGHTQIVISNTTYESLQRFIHAVGIFTEGYCFAAGTHQADAAITKTTILSEYLKGKEFETTVIVGDSRGDMEMKQVGNATTYLYRHSHRSFDGIEADYKIRDLRKVLVEI